MTHETIPQELDEASGKPGEVWPRVRLLDALLEGGHSSALTDNEFKLLVAYIAKTYNDSGLCEHGQASLGKLAGIGRDNVAAVRARLVAKGYVEVVRVGGGRWNTSAVRVTIPATPPPPRPKRKSRRPSNAATANALSSQGVSAATPRPVNALTAQGVSSKRPEACQGNALKGDAETPLTSSGNALGSKGRTTALPTRETYGVGATAFVAEEAVAFPSENASKRVVVADEEDDVPADKINAQRLAEQAARMNAPVQGYTRADLYDLLVNCYGSSNPNTKQEHAVNANGFLDSFGTGHAADLLKVAYFKERRKRPKDNPVGLVVRLLGPEYEFEGMTAVEDPQNPGKYLSFDDLALPPKGHRYGGPQTPAVSHTRTEKIPKPTSAPGTRREAKKTRIDPDYEVAKALADQRRRDESSGNSQMDSSCPKLPSLPTVTIQSGMNSLDDEDDDPFANIERDLRRDLPSIRASAEQNS